jgi:hypothetical protein
MAERDYVEIQKRAEGKLVVVGWDVDRVMGIFSTVDKAMKALEEAPERYDHNWWMEFRDLDQWKKPSIFERILVRTRIAPQSAQG